MVCAVRDGVARAVSPVVLPGVGAAAAAALAQGPDRRRHGPAGVGPRGPARTAEGAHRRDLRRHERGQTVVVGDGEVGRTVVGRLAAADLYTVADVDEMSGVDVVGDATDPDVLREAGVHEARSVILAVPDDTDTEFTTLVARDVGDGVAVIARVAEAEAVPKPYRAGADYALALATVSGRMIASAVLDADVISMDTQLEVVRTGAPGLVGRTLAEADVRARTGCTVVAVERNGDVLTELGPEFRVLDGDDLVVAGTDAGTNRFTELPG